MKINSEISERIVTIIENEGENKNTFAVKMGYMRSQTIYDIVKGKSAPSFDFFYKFYNAGYSDIYNIDWLITGRGDMLKEPTDNGNKRDEISIDDLENLHTIDSLGIFKRIAESERITITQLELKIGASKGVLSRAIKNGTDVQSKWVMKVVDNYPQYNIYWLITGKGEANNSKPMKSSDNLLAKLERVNKACKWLIYKGYADTHSGLAARLGYTKSSFSQLLNGKVPLSDSFIDAICNLDGDINKIWIHEEVGDIAKGTGEDNSGKSIRLMRELVETKDAVINTQQETIDSLKQLLAIKSPKKDPHNTPGALQR